MEGYEYSALQQSASGRLTVQADDFSHGDDGLASGDTAASRMSRIENE